MRTRALLTTAATVLGGIAATMVLASPASAAPGKDSAFDYAAYPGNATVNSACDAQDLQTESFKIGDWTGATLQHAPALHGGDQIIWRVKAVNADCVGSRATLAMYATVEAAYAAYSDQTLANQASWTFSAAGDTGQVVLTVLPGFTGPYQVDAIAGVSLPKVGPNGNKYSLWGDTNDPKRRSDNRSMLVAATGGSINGQLIWPDKVTQPYNYAIDRTNQLPTDANGDTCQVNSLNDLGGGLGLYANGVLVDPQTYQVKAGDKLVYRFRIGTDQCAGTNVTFALYRNPQGGDGLIDSSINQRLLDSRTVQGNKGDVLEIPLEVPSWLRGGYQLNLALGNAIPILGDAGGRYGDTLKWSNHNVIG